MRYSRYVDGVIEYVDPWAATEQFVDRLLSFAKRQLAPPILYYENDGYLEAISRHRTELLGAFRFVAPPSVLVDDLQDKARFDELSRRRSLPTPPSVVVHGSAELRRMALPLPVVIKPLTRYDRDNGWLSVGGSAKAIQVSSARDVEELERRLDTTQLSLLAQELIPGPESRVESYHVYARTPGAVTAHFTGRKLRTWPLAYGHSTALITTHAPDVDQMGAGIVESLQLSGVAKLDFKRDAEGQLHLLEINPRFTLWNHLGAVGGVNIPALVYEDLCGAASRPRTARGRPGITWCDVPQDFKAARAASIGLARWLLWASRTNIKVDLALDDPMPFIRGRLLRSLHKRRSNQ